jgi:hypothetical protein
MDSENVKRIKRQKEIEKQLFESTLNESEEEFKELIFGSDG